MKILNLTKVALTVVVAAQMLSSSAYAAPKFKETLLTTKKEGILDPYFQLRTSKIQELTDEEAMEFINEGKVGVGTKEVKIPPRPPESDKGPREVKDNNKDGGLVAATGGGAAPTIAGVLDGVIMIVDKLIAIGQKIMPTIEKGRAVVTNNPMAAVSVLPRLDTKDPVLHDMGGWSIPMTKHYKITYSNGLGSDVVSFVYSITYQYGGEHEGKGKYLTGIRASARNITISWGFDLDASSQLIQISNVGTSSNVIAGATVEMSYTVKNWTRQITTNESFFISGDGKLYKLD